MNIIYKVTNIIFPNKCYIGFDSAWPDRKKEHYKSSFKDYNKKYKFYYSEFHVALRNFGWDNFHWEVIYQSLDGEHTLKVMESHFIKEYNSYYKWNNGGYNMTLGGEGTLGWCPSEEWKKNRSGEKNPMYGNPGFLFGKKGKEHPCYGLKRDDTANRNKKNAKNYIVISPTGNLQHIFNLSEFCKQNNLSISNMVQVAKEKLKCHKGWSCSYGIS